jgi:CheY-like chemotaxis protein
MAVGLAILNIHFRNDSSIMNTSRSSTFSPQEISPSSQIATVLVIDDSATNRIVIEKQLKKLGCCVSSASDGASGLAVIAQGGLDLVLLDCQLPDISGYDVARRVREKEMQQDCQQSVRLPIIAISGDTDMAHRQLCFDSGMDGILAKPLPLEVLREMLTLWCDNATEQARREEAPRVDLRNLYRTTSLQDFAVLRVCAASFDLPLFGRLLHRMKGAALVLGASHIVASLEQLESMSGVDAKTSPEQLAAALEVLRQQLQAQ